MSVTSATDTFTEGPELFDQEKYQTKVSTTFEPDPIRMEEQFKKPLTERIVTIHSHPDAIYAEYDVDDLRIRAPSDAFRQYQVDQWKSVKAGEENKVWGWNVTSMGSGVVAIIGAACLLMGKSEVAKIVGATLAGITGPVLLVGGAIFAVVSLVFASSASSSVKNAEDQIHKWSQDPALKIGQERNDAYAKGFPFMFMKKLKIESSPSTTGRFHPKQVEHAYRKYFDAFCQKLLDESCPSCKSKWMILFLAFNPVSQDWMTYGLGQIPPHMKPVVDDYMQLESRLKDIEKSYENLKTEVRKTAQNSIESYKKLKEEHLKPLSEKRDKAIEQARKTRDLSMQRPPVMSEHHNDLAQDTFARTHKALTKEYERGAAPIIKKYDKLIQEVERGRDLHLQKLDEQKAAQFGNNYNAAHELMIRAKQAWDNKGYQPVNFQQYFPYQPVWQQPASAPPQPSYGYPEQQPAYGIMPGAGG